MKYLKAAIVGLLASLVMFLLIQGLMLMGFAPFNTSPSSAILLSLDLPAKPWGLLLHFLHGTIWSIVFVAYCRGHDTVQKGFGLALLLWIIMMLVYSPVMGWGLFGFAGTPLLDPDSPLFLQGGLRYPISTLMLHLVYGAIIGWLNPVWRGENPDEIPSPPGDTPSSRSEVGGGQEFRRGEVHQKAHQVVDEVFDTAERKLKRMLDKLHGNVKVHPQQEPTAVIMEIDHHKGEGRLRSLDGQELFFNDETSGDDFRHLDEGDGVPFFEGHTEEGPYANAVRLVHKVVL